MKIVLDIVAIDQRLDLKTGQSYSELVVQAEDGTEFRLPDHNGFVEKVIAAYTLGKTAEARGVPIPANELGYTGEDIEPQGQPWAEPQEDRQFSASEEELELDEDEVAMPGHSTTIGELAADTAPEFDAPPAMDVAAMRAKAQAIPQRKPSQAQAARRTVEAITKKNGVQKRNAMPKPRVEVEPEGDDDGLFAQG